MGGTSAPLLTTNETIEATDEESLAITTEVIRKSARFRGNILFATILASLLAVVASMAYRIFKETKPFSKHQQPHWQFESNSETFTNAVFVEKDDKTLISSGISRSST